MKDQIYALTKRLMRFLKLGIIVIIIFVFTLEVGIRIILESRWVGKDYGDVFSMAVMNEGGYLLPNVDMQVANGLGGKVSWINNSKGFRSRVEFGYEKPPNTIRVLSLGDSFNAGYRVGQEETLLA